MKVFVTGGTGLVGSHLLLDLLKRGYQVKALARETSQVDKLLRIFSWYSDQPEALFRRIEWVTGNLCDPVAMEEALNGCTQVYHCAALISFDPADRRDLFRINAQGTGVLVDAAIRKEVERFCYVSSVAALGSVDPPMLVDEETLRNNSQDYSGYGLSKFKGELEVWRGAVEGLRVLIVNPSVIVGPGDWRVGIGKLFSLVARSMPFYPTGTTGFVDVRDVSQTMVRLMEKGVAGQSFCLTGENLAHREVLNLVARMLGKGPLRIPLTRPVLSLAWRAEWLRSRVMGQSPLLTRESARSSSNRTLFSNQKVRRELNFTFIPIADSIQHMADIYLREHQPARTTSRG